MIYNITFTAAKNYEPKNKSLVYVNYFIADKDFKFYANEFLSYLNIPKTNVSAKRFLDGKDDDFSVIFYENKTQKYILKKVDYDKITTDFFRNDTASVISNIKDDFDDLVVNIPDCKKLNAIFGSHEYLLQSVAEGLLLGNYTFDEYKSEKKQARKVRCILRTDKIAVAKSAIKKAQGIAEAVYFSRDLVNEPANTLYPQEFVKRVRKAFTGSDVKVEVLTEAALKKKNMNALLSVGQASVHPPVLVKLHYKPKGKVKDKIALVGKGVMYDAGGLSIKPTSGMVEMKGDMAGAAAVVGIFYAADKIKFAQELYGVIPVVENVISGSAYKPGDIIHTASGKTIEVGNTDAEGRLILADALEFAEKLKPNKIIDFATLTGACLVALGESIAGMFTDNEELAGKIYSSGEKTYEKVWRLPMPKEYEDLLKSDLADISNISKGRWAGSITAAEFLKFFLSDDMKKNWAHLDIAGPALKNDLSSYTKKYATGFGVRLITEYLTAK